MLETLYRLNGAFLPGLIHVTTVAGFQDVQGSSPGTHQKQLDPAADDSSAARSHTGTWLQQRRYVEHNNAASGGVRRVLHLC